MTGHVSSCTRVTTWAPALPECVRQSRCAVGRGCVSWCSFVRAGVTEKLNRRIIILTSIRDSKLSSFTLFQQSTHTVNPLTLVYLREDLGDPRAGVTRWRTQPSRLAGCFYLLCTSTLPPLLASSPSISGAKSSPLLISQSILRGIFC